MHNAIAIADVGRDGETRYPGEIDSAPAAVTGNQEVGKQVCEGTDLLRLRGWTHGSPAKLFQTKDHPEYEMGSLRFEAENSPLSLFDQTSSTANAGFAR